MTSAQRAIAADLAADEPRPAEERAATREAISRGLISPLRGDFPERGLFLLKIGKVLGMTGSRPGHIRQLGTPASPKEACRWAGWCRTFVDNKWAHIFTGPSGGVSGNSRHSWVVELAVARRFGFVPGRLASAARVARAEAKQFGFIIPEWQWPSVVRPKASRTRRAVRRLWIAERARLAKPVKVGRQPIWMSTSTHCGRKNSAVRLSIGDEVAIISHWETPQWKIAQKWAAHPGACENFKSAVQIAINNG